MAITVKNSRVGIAPRKVRLVCDLIRNKKASDALRTLRFCEKKETAIVLAKLINSGLAIAQESGKYDIDNLNEGILNRSPENSQFFLSYSFDDLPTDVYKNFNHYQFGNYIITINQDF